MDPLVQLTMLQPNGSKAFHNMLLKWSYVISLRTAENAQAAHRLTVCEL
jgi:hypothetical protein